MADPDDDATSKPDREDRQEDRREDRERERKRERDRDRDRDGDSLAETINACVHQGGSLCDGRVEGDIVTCPLHGWEFDLRSGACMTVPGERVSRCLVTVEGDGIDLEAAE